MIYQEEFERSKQQMRDLEKAHKESMEQFQAKVKAEQKAQVEELTKKMENDRQEVRQCRRLGPFK